MSNPYRVRPTRSRADPSLGGYGVHNQKPWNPGPVQRPPNVDSNAPFQPPPVTNQSKPDESWNWNGNNGNDSWNWSIDQPENQSRQHPLQQQTLPHQHQTPQQLQHSPQAQQHPQPQQQSPQNQFIQTYPNQKQSVPPPSQENYYNNLNGNNRPGSTINQHSSSDRETPRTIPPVREPTPKQPDLFPQYTNYSHNQQFSTPPRPSSNASSYSGPIDQSQWPSEQQSQSLPYAPNQILNQKQSTHQTSPLQPPPINNYNWGNADQQNVPFHSWQNLAETSASNYWQESNTTKQQEQFPDNISNNFSQPNQQALNQSQPRNPNAPYPPANEITNDQPKFYNPRESQENSTHPQNWLAQNTLVSNHTWSKSNSENTNVLSRQQSLPSNNTWSQSEETNSTWQQVGPSNIPNSQYRQPKLQPGGSLEESALSENNKSEWQHVHAPPSHFNSSTTSTTSGSLANMSSSTEQLEDRKRSLTPTTSFTSLNEFQTQTSNSSQNNVENNTASNIQENFNAQNSVDLDWGADAEWNTVSELSNSVNNMSLNTKFNQQMDNPSSSKEEHPTHAVREWNRQPVSGLKLNNSENKPDNAPILVSEQNSVENPIATPHEQFDSHQGNNLKSSENVSQANYDQWYKQNVRTKPENDFFNSNSMKQWPSEHNVENYENIQQPTEFINLEVVTPESQERDLFGSRESINKETLDNDQVVRQTTSPKETVMRDFRQEISNIEVPTVQQVQQPLQTEQAPDNYEFASNDRNTFLETGELTDPHSQEHELVPPNQDDENDEVPNDIPFLREVPGQSSSIDPRRNDPTGQEQYAQGVVGAMPPRMSDPRRNDPSGQEQQQHVVQNRPSIQNERAADRRDVPSGQERVKSVQQSQLTRSSDLDNVERRNDPSGRERSLPPQQSRNEPSGEEQRVAPPIPQANSLESGVVREIPGRGNEPEELIQQSDSGLRQIPGGASSNESVQIIPDDRSTGARVVTGSQQITAAPPLNVTQDSSSDNRTKREEAVGASIVENQSGIGPSNRRDSYEDGDDEGSGNSREGSRDRRRESSPKSSRHPRYDYNRKPAYYDRERDFDEDYYYDRRRQAEFDRSFDSREDVVGRDYSRSFRDEDRRHASRDDLDRDRDRLSRDDLDRRSRMKDEIDERDGRRRIDDSRRDRSSDPRRLDREGREFDPRYRGEREFVDRDRERRRENGRPRRYPEYDPRDARENYRRDYYDESYGRNSRPSSRSSYNDRDRDYTYMRSRDPYSSYGYNNYPGYDYGPHYNSNYYAYLENLRRTDPAAYAEWYHKYYQHQQQISRGANSSYQEDRASVHSGRSSCDDRNSSDKRNLTDMSLTEDQTNVSARLTPTKFSTAHTKGLFSVGALLHVHAAYPTDGERARIDILSMDHILPHDTTLRELRYYPGPLIKGVTHKKTIIEYCENKIKKASSNDEIVEVSSYVLLYELMIMLIQQNGNVVGVDIASLLLRNKDAYPYEVNKPIRENKRRESTISQRSGASGGDKSSSEVIQPHEKEEPTKPRKTVEQLTDEFRNTLLYGLVQEALEFAMVEGLWGHALFLASKLDKRTHASVMTRFANSLPPQDPLQTLYQLHSGRVPASVTCISDARWDDWRPHLAMIISNTSTNPEINRRSISNLGDTLATRGDIYAAHFCYILSQVDFGAYGSSNVKLVLIGANHHKPYSEFISTEAIMLTEIYEYARKLSEPFTLVELQTFKFNIAIKMVDYGLIEKALLYIEQVAVNIVGEPEKYKQSFINDVYLLGDRLKYHDPVYKESDDDVANLSWLKNLTEIVGKCEKGEIVQENSHYLNQSHATESNLETSEIQQQQMQHKWKATQNDYGTDNNSSTLGNNVEVDSHGGWQPKSTVSSVQNSYGLSNEREVQYKNETNNETPQHYQSYQQDYSALQQQTYDQQNYTSPDYSQSEWNNYSKVQYTSEQQNAEHSELQNQWSYEQQQQPQLPSISMGPSGGKQYDPLEELESLEPSRLGANKSTAEAKKQSDKSAEKKSANGGGSWFGGLFSKLAIKPKNQMILPDDSNPAIVWDSVAKKWVNKDDEDGGNSAPLAPPPKMSELPGFKPASTPAVPPAAAATPPGVASLPTMNPATVGAPAPVVPVTSGSVSMADETMNSSKLITGGGNMYKLSRGRNMRANYVDVMNPGGSKSASTPAPQPVIGVPTPIGSPAMPIAASSPQLFIPAPVNDPNAPLDFLTPVSVAAPQSQENPQAGPMMYNPMDMKDRSQKNQARSRYPPR